jgi:hypothetical protein
MAATVIDAPEQEKTLADGQQPAAAPQAPAMDSAAAVAEAGRIVSAQQAAEVSPRPAELSPDVQAYIAEIAQRSYAGAGEVVLWLVAMIAFLAITTAGIWMNAAGTFPHIWARVA